MSAQISLDHYDRRVAVRNRVAKIAGCFLLFAGGAILIPSFYIGLVTRRIFRTYCRGLVLDYNGLVFDRRIMELYQSSNAVTVFFRAREPDADQNTDHDAESDSELQNNLQAMRYKLKNDPEILESEITFALYPELQSTTARSSIGPMPLFDTVIMDGGLSGLDPGEARRSVEVLKEYCKPGGHIYIHEAARPHSESFRRSLKWLKRAMDSTLNLHPLDEWVDQLETSGEFAVVKRDRRSFGLLHTYVLQRRENNFKV